jgi:quercetin dioxygenase-like cupin family protein
MMKKMLSIAAVLAAAVPLGLWKSTLGAAEGGVGVDISRNDSRPVGVGPAETFTGEVSVKPLFDANPSRNFSSAEVSFTPCARTAWHTHPAGQTLIVTSGSGWVQEWGGQRQDIAAGDVVWTEPGVKHWHGGTAHTAMTHIAIQGLVDGTPVDWMEHVTDEQYLK